MKTTHANIVDTVTARNIARDSFVLQRSVVGPDRWCRPGAGPALYVQNLRVVSEEGEGDDAVLMAYDLEAGHTIELAPLVDAE